MLKEVLQSLSGPASNIAFTYPSSNGFGGPSVTPQGVFTKLLNMLSKGGASNFLGTYTTMQAPGQNFNQAAAAQAYANSLAGGQNFYGAVNQKPSQREAFSPGSVINSLQAPPIPQQGFDPYGQLAGAINPLQGFAGQSGVTTTGALPGAGSLIPGQISPGGYSLPGGFSMPGAGGFGKWSMFIMPLVSLVGLLKSFFGFGGMAAMKPVQINKEALDYKISLQKYDKAERTDGSFDDDYWGEGEGESEGIDSSKLEI